MPQPPPLAVALTEWQKIDALKRTRELYQTELKKTEAELTDILVACAEADYIAQYVGEQPEVKELRAKKPEVEAREKRRQYLIALIERLESVIPKQPEVKPSLPSTGGKPGGMKRF